MNKLIISLLAAIVLLGGLFVLLKPSPDLTGKTVFEEENVKVIEVDSANLRFYMDGVENPDIRVKEGDKVKINFKSSEGYHDWMVDEFNASTERVNPGESASVEFVANKKGVFEYYCSVGRHRENGMKGNFIVEYADEPS